MNKKENLWQGVIRYTDIKKPSVKIMYYAMYVFMIILCATMLFPILWVFISSIKSYDEIIKIPPTLFPHSFEPENIIKTWKAMKFYRYFINSLIVTGGSVLSTLFFCGLLGYVLSRLRPKGSKLIYTLLFMTLLMPTTTNLIPLYMTYINFPILGNLSNTFLPFWIGAGAGVYNVILFKQFFDAIPMSYIESAKIDGCSVIGIFLKIIAPLSKPILLVVGIFAFNGSWNDFLMPYLLLKDSSKQTIGVALFSSKSLPLNQSIIAIMFAIIVPITVFCFLQKRIMDNLVMTGIKG